MGRSDSSRIGARGPAEQEALAGERVLARWAANHSQGWRAVGGALVLTRSRLVFCPSTFERRLRGLPWAGRLDELVRLETVPPTGSLFDGGLRARLELRLAGGVRELFVVDDPQQVAKAVHPYLDRSKS